MAVAEIIEWLLMGGGSAAGGYGSYLVHKHMSKPTAPVETDGRTHLEWYEIIKSMGREEYEALSRPALDGLEDSDYGWDVVKLLGPEYFNLLRKDFYPEKHCEFCGQFTDGVPGNCFWDGPCHNYRENERQNKQRALQENKQKAYELEQSRRREKIKKLQSIEHTVNQLKKNYDEVDIVKFQHIGTSAVSWRIQYRGESHLMPMAALIAFQEHMGLTGNGRMDEETREELIHYIKSGGKWNIVESKPNKIGVKYNAWTS